MDQELTVLMVQTEYSTTQNIHFSFLPYIFGPTIELEEGIVQL